MTQSETRPTTPDDLLFFETTPAMRERLRELSDTTGKDDYDRVVLLLLGDFARLLAYVAPLHDAVSRMGERDDLEAEARQLRADKGMLSAEIEQLRHMNQTMFERDEGQKARTTRLEDERNNTQAAYNELATENERLKKALDGALWDEGQKAEIKELRATVRTLIACLKESQGGWIDDWFVTIEVAELLLREGAST